MAGTRIEKYRKYRQSIAARSDNIPVLKTPTTDGDFILEEGYYKKIVLKRRIQNSLILLAIVLIVALLVIFGVIVF